MFFPLPLSLHICTFSLSVLFVLIVNSSSFPFLVLSIGRPPGDSFFLWFGSSGHRSLLEGCSRRPLYRWAPVLLLLWSPHCLFLWSCYWVSPAFVFWLSFGLWCLGLCPVSPFFLFHRFVLLFCRIMFCLIFLLMSFVVFLVFSFLSSMCVSLSSGLLVMIFVFRTSGPLRLA